VLHHPTVVRQVVLDAVTVWLEANAWRHHVHPLRELTLHLREQVRVEAQLEQCPSARLARELRVVRLVGPIPK
jgi:hypothetical protein